MEKAERTFRSQITKCNPTRDDVITWLYQVSKGVKFLHRNSVIHRDIKPDNILMFLQHGNKLVAKLADFGVSKIISRAERSGTFSVANGTLLWMAPEALENQTGKFKNTKMLDIFTLGMVFYFGLNKGCHPFIYPEDNEDSYIPLVSRMNGPYSKSKMLASGETAAGYLLSEMMEKEPFNRPTILEVLDNCLFWKWEKEQLFLIRVAICLSKQDCSEVSKIKDQIDREYSQYFWLANDAIHFNWINLGRKYGVNIPKLLFTTKHRKHPTGEYGDGSCVTKFLKLFRDKYVHYPDMNKDGALAFSDSDGIFCEEKYVKLLTSLCPNLSAVLYNVLSRYRQMKSLLPLRKLYFPCILDRDRAVSGGYTWYPLNSKTSNETARDILNSVDLRGIHGVMVGEKNDPFGFAEY